MKTLGFLESLGLAVTVCEVVECRGELWRIRICVRAHKPALPCNGVFEALERLTAGTWPPGFFCVKFWRECRLAQRHFDLKPGRQVQRFGLSLRRHRSWDPPKLNQRRSGDHFPSQIQR